MTEKLEQRTVRRKVDVCEKGAVGVEMYFIVRGEAEVLLELDAAPIATVMPGSFFGEGALLGGDGAVRNAFVRATKTMQLYVLTAEGLEEVFADYPGVEGTRIIRGKQRERQWQRAVGAVATTVPCQEPTPEPVLLGLLSQLQLQSAAAEFSQSEYEEQDADTPRARGEHVYEPEPELPTPLSATTQLLASEQESLHFPPSDELAAEPGDAAAEARTDALPVLSQAEMVLEIYSSVDTAGRDGAVVILRKEDYAAFLQAIGAMCDTNKR